MSIFVFVLILSFLVIIHELGHFIAAKWANVKVDEFGLGYPPKAFRLFRWKKTDFTLNWIPFGGFVRMQGEELEKETSDNADQKKLIGQFYQAGVWKKIVIILAGATVNFVFGVLAFTIVFSKMGLPEYISDARIGEVIENSPAHQAGIQENVNITAIKIGDEKINVSTPKEVIDIVSEHRGETVSIFTSGICEKKTCEEIENEYQIYIRTQVETPENEGSMGVVFNSLIFVFYPSREMPIRSAIYGVEQAFSLGWQIVQAFSSLLTDMFTKGKLPQDIAGPVGIVHQAQSTGIFQEGWLTVLSFTGMLSINLAVMNVLPLPPLDGGRAVFVVLEALFSKKRTQKLEYIFNYGGYILLFGLIIVITIKDVLRIIYG